MASLKVTASYSYEVYDDYGEILESNTDFETIQECIAEGMNILEQYEEDPEE